jgi:hypothetical protein
MTSAQLNEHFVEYRHYEKGPFMSKVSTVSTQVELDKAISIEEFDIIYIKSDPSVWLQLPTSGDPRVEALGNTRVDVSGTAHIVASDSSHVKARDNSHVEARDTSHVWAVDNAHVVANGNSHVLAWDTATVEAGGHSHVEAGDDSCVWALDNAHVVAFECTTVYIHSPQVHVESTGTVVDMIGPMKETE